ncbi:28618_t:CDS:1, partial [Racocetra persica]
HLRRAISDINNKSSGFLKHDDVEEYYKKIDKQLNEFKEFDKKVLKINDFIYMLDLAISLIKELKNMNLKSPDDSLNEIDLIDKIDQNLLKWVKDYAKIAKKFNNRQFYEGFSIFNKNNDLVIFNIQEELLTEVDDIRKHLTKKSKELDNIWYLNKENIKK